MKSNQETDTGAKSVTGIRLNSLNAVMVIIAVFITVLLVYATYASIGSYDGLREAIIALMAGERRQVDTSSFSNDMTTFTGMDDVLTLLVHLGYLGYDFDTESVFIPNQEILKNYII